MTEDRFASVLPTLLAELVHGSPDPAARTYMLNQGDQGLLAALEQLSAAQASATLPGGGASIAAHVDHLRYGLAVLNRWGQGALPPPSELDWTASWKRGPVREAEWQALRVQLRQEAEAWLAVLRRPPEVSEREAGWMVGSVAHLAYHLGAIRQIDRATRGPTAEDEARAQAQA